MTKNILLLSIDGGGVRGKIVATFLALLEKDLGKSIYNSFDMYAGTSTGALIILGISANQYSSDAIAGLYNDVNLSRIFSKSLWGYIPYFGAKYTGTGKRKLFNEIFTDKRYLSVKKPTVVTAYDFVNSKAVVFKSSGGSDSKYNPRIAEVADATTAAPSYFPSVITQENKPRNLIDGGITSNNPSLCLVDEAIAQGYELKSIKLLSFGTGYSAISKELPSVKNWGKLNWLEHGLIDDFMLGDSSMTEYHCSTILKGNYLRINGELDDVDSALDNISLDNLNKIDILAKKWYQIHKKEVINFLTLEDGQ